MIVDTSIVIALGLRQPTSIWIEKTLEAHRSEHLRMSLVNIAETSMTLNRKAPQAIGRFKQILAEARIVPLEIDAETVEIAIAARSRFPLNFGDCFAYAHAHRRNEALITLDADFLKTDLPRILHPDRS